MQPFCKGVGCVDEDDENAKFQGGVVSEGDVLESKGAEEGKHHPNASRAKEHDAKAPHKVPERLACSHVPVRSHLQDRAVGD